MLVVTLTDTIHAMESFTEDESTALTVFKHQIGDLLTDDFRKRDENLIRWLRARNLDVDKAEEMIRKSMKWRHDNQLDSILNETVDEYMENNYVYFLDGTDRQGRLVWTIPFGTWDVRKTVEEDGPERVVRHALKMMEKMMAKMQDIVEADTSQTRAVRCTFVCSMAGFSFHQITNMRTVHALLPHVSILEAHYPEILDSVHFIDAPAVCSTVFNMIKPFLTPRTISKVDIKGCHRDQWEPKVLEIVAPEQIRREFGGTKE